MARIPAGWTYLTSERNHDDAWRLAIEYKQARERVRGGTFVHVTVRPAAGVHWILTREELRAA